MTSLFQSTCAVGFFFFLESSLLFAAKSPDENLACKIVTLLLALLTWCLPLADEDEDGDRITVRSDEEMKAMLSYVSTATNPDFPPCLSAFLGVFLPVSGCLTGRYPCVELEFGYSWIKGRCFKAASREIHGHA